MDEEKKGSKKIIFIIVAVIIVILVIISLVIWYFIKSWQIVTYPTSTASPTILSSPTIYPTTETLKTYTSEQYGFSFQYPSSWQKKESLTESPELVFSVAFTDPERLKEIDYARCINNEAVNWGNPEPSFESCQEVLNSLSTKEKEKLLMILHERDIYVLVFQPATSKPLKEWLTDYYQAFEGELADFQPGLEIELADQNGYVANTACCDDYNVSYVVQKDDRIYQFGTNYSDGDSNGRNSLLEDLSKNFKFIK